MAWRLVSAGRDPLQRRPARRPPRPGRWERPGARTTAAATRPRPGRGDPVPPGVPTATAATTRPRPHTGTPSPHAYSLSLSRMSLDESRNRCPRFRVPRRPMSRRRTAERSGGPRGCRVGVAAALRHTPHSSPGGLTPPTRLQTPPSPAHGLVRRPRSRRPAWLLRVTPARVPRGAAPSASSVSHSVPVVGCTERTHIHSTNVYEALTPQPRRPREDEEMWTLNPGWKSEWPSHTQGHGAGGRNPRQENREPP